MKWLKSVLLCIVVNLSAVELPLVVVIPSFRNAQYYKGNLDSVFNQHYSNYRVIYIADDDYGPGSDGTGALVKNYVTEKNQWHRFTLVCNKKRHLALRNHYRAFLSCRPDEIVVLLDGDDQLANPEVFNKVNAMYSNAHKEVWYTYGNFNCILDAGCSTWAKEIPAHVLAANSLRQWPEMATHLRTYRAWLAQQIHIDDFFYDDDFYKMTCDVALFEPMMEMAAYRYNWTTEILYHYNDNTPINDHRISSSQQGHLGKHIRAKTPYQPLAGSMEYAITNLWNQAQADVVVFSDGNIDELRNVLTGVSKKFAHVGSVAAIYKTADSSVVSEYKKLACEFPEIIFKQQPDGETLVGSFFAQVLQSNAQYLVLMDAKESINTIDLRDSIRWLEMTHAFTFYLNPHKNVIESLAVPIELSLNEDQPNTVCAFRNNPSIIAAFNFSWQGLYRKKDLTNRFDAWQCNFDLLPSAIRDTIPANSASLFYRGA